MDASAHRLRMGSDFRLEAISDSYSNFMCKMLFQNGNKVIRLFCLKI